MSALLNEAETIRAELAELKAELEGLPDKLQAIEKAILSGPADGIKAAMAEKAGLAERREILEVSIFRAEEALLLNQTRQLEADLRPLAELEAKAEETETAAAEALRLAQATYDQAIAERRRLTHNRQNISRQIEERGHDVARLRNQFKQTRRAANG